MDGPSPADRPETLAARVAARQWYHTLELAPGVVTPGYFDTRPIAARLPMPARLDGLRCLDIGTFDGFWAFEMERRGAGEVVAADILDERRWDWPAVVDPADYAAITERKGGGDGFSIAAEALGSRVRRLDLSVYDLDPEVHGMFDLVYIGSLLLHLRDPIGALERARAVTRGRLLSVDAFSIPLTLSAPRRPTFRLEEGGRPYWLKPSLRGLREVIIRAGFRIESGPAPFLMPPGLGHPRPELRAYAVRTRAARNMLFCSRFGDPHAAVLARPLPGAAPPGRAPRIG
ncbi:MAG: tRNA (mo5U34)-methyltransferase [Solirubrobacteraceae bacterium]|nr:tRNA (mo5U34)-methyltransferase [Solirubrobacteraceae bacterium]